MSEVALPDNEFLYGVLSHNASGDTRLFLLIDCQIDFNDGVLRGGVYFPLQVPGLRELGLGQMFYNWIGPEGEPMGTTSMHGLVERDGCLFVVLALRWVHADWQDWLPDLGFGFYLGGQSLEGGH